MHDLHLWSIAADDASLTAHIVLDDDMDMDATRRTAIEMLETRFSIAHDYPDGSVALRRRGEYPRIAAPE